MRTFLIAAVLILACTTAYAASSSFVEGSFKPAITKSDGECTEIAIGKLTVEKESIKGRWSHPRASGEIIISKDGDAISAKLYGRLISGSATWIQQTGRDLLFVFKVYHKGGSCGLSLKLTGVFSDTPTVATAPEAASPVAASPVAAQPVAAVPILAQYPKGPARPDDVAVIIGNVNYGKTGKDIPDVTPARADAEEFKRYAMQALGIVEDNIIYLKDASQADMLITFGNETDHRGQLFNYVKPGISRVLVYYSGHGAPGGQSGRSYIVPVDAQASMIRFNGYPLSTLYRNLSKLPAESVTVVLEACFSGASDSGSVISNASPIYMKAKETIVPGNITIITAGGANQIASWEKDKSHSLFTKYFLLGMSGKADAEPYGNGDGEVGYDELGRYLKGTMTYFARRYYGREQTAQIVLAKDL